MRISASPDLLNWMPSIAAHLLYGMPAIALFLNISPRQGYHFAEKEACRPSSCPAWSAPRRTTLTSWLAEQEAGSSKAAASWFAPIRAAHAKSRLPISKPTTRAVLLTRRVSPDQRDRGSPNGSVSFEPVLARMTRIVSSGRSHMGK